MLAYSGIPSPVPTESAPMSDLLHRPIRRRTFLAGALAGTAALGAPAVLRAQERSLKVGVYGGYFKDSFDANVFPAFTEETGITVESVAEPTGEAWLVQLQQAARAGQAPADVSMMAQTAMLKGMAAELWAPLDESRLDNLGEVLPRFVNRYPPTTGSPASARSPGTSRS